MKTKANIEKIEKELENGFGMKVSRPGIHYAWYSAWALDRGIQTRAKRAKIWRNRVLTLAEMGTVYTEKVMIGPNYSDNPRWYKKATAYILHGKDRFFVIRGVMYETKNYERKSVC